MIFKVIRLVCASRLGPRFNIFAICGQKVFSSLLESLLPLLYQGFLCIDILYSLSLVRVTLRYYHVINGFCAAQAFKIPNVPEEIAWFPAVKPVCMEPVAQPCNLSYGVHAIFKLDYFDDASLVPCAINSDSSSLYSCSV